MTENNKFDLAVSIGYSKFIDENGFKAMKDNSIKAIELSFDDYSNMDFKRVKKLSEDYDVKLWSLHLPFMPFEDIDISSIDSNMRNSNVFMLSDIISRASDIGVNRFVIHASGEPVLPPVRAERMKCSKDSLYKLSEFAKKSDSVIAVENLPRTCLGNNSREINELTSVNENLFVCFDTNHLFGQTASEFVNDLNKKIETVHISDYDFTYERHWLPGLGKVNWKEIIDLLNSKQYKGPWVYEVSLFPKNVPDKTKITLSEILENYNTLVKKKDR